MCDIDKAIYTVQNGETMECCCPDCEERRWAYKLAIEALKEKQARENPQPLTLDELKEREGKPVWVKEITEEPIDGDYWGIVDIDFICTGSYGVGAVISPATDGKSICAQTPLSDYNKTWLAYSQEPKEV